MTSGESFRAFFTMISIYLAWLAVVLTVPKSLEWWALGILLVGIVALNVYVWWVTRSDKHRHPSTVRARLEEGLRRGRERAAKEQK